ncbi:hypothetical protein HK405_011170, partial [Cladochytrium tenue]
MPRGPVSIVAIRLAKPPSRRPADSGDGQLVVAAGGDNLELNVGFHNESRHAAKLQWFEVSLVREYASAEAFLEARVETSGSSADSPAPSVNKGKFAIPTTAASMIPEFPPVTPVEVDQVANVKNAEAHLGLLHRFCMLESKDQLADWRFLCHAERRYLKWLDYLQEKRPDPESIPLPPIDVALIWHAHMLNPLRYYEDCFHIFGNSYVPYYMPLDRMHSLPGITYDPQDGSQEQWTNFTDEPFTIQIGDMTTFTVCCPWCNIINSKVDADSYVWYRMKDKGIKCEGCKSELTCNNMSAKRFLDDCEKFLRDENKVL